MSVPRAAHIAIDEAAVVAHRAMTQSLQGAVLGQRYWLVDPLIVDAFRALPAVQGVEILPIRVDHVDMDASVRPYLVSAVKQEALAKWTSLWLQRCVAECLMTVAEGAPRARSLCASIDTPMTARSLAAWMAARATVRDATGRVRLFRFWDPRVMQHLVRGIVNAEDWLPGFDGYWGFLDSFGRYQSWTHDGTTRQVALQPRVLTAGEERFLEEISTLNALFEMNECRALAPSDHLWTALMEANEAARKLGVSDMRSRLSVACMRWRAGVPLESSDRFLQLLAAARGAGVSIDAALAEIDDVDLELIRAQALSASRRDVAYPGISPESHA